VSLIPKLSSRRFSQITGESAIAVTWQLEGPVSGRSPVRVLTGGGHRFRAYLSSSGSSAPGFRLQAEPQIVGPIAWRSQVPPPGQASQASTIKYANRGHLSLGSLSLHTSPDHATSGKSPWDPRVSSQLTPDRLVTKMIPGSALGGALCSNRSSPGSCPSRFHVFCHHKNVGWGLRLLDTPQSNVQLERIPRICHFRFLDDHSIYSRMLLSGSTTYIHFSSPGISRGPLTTVIPSLAIH